MDVLAVNPLATALNPAYVPGNNLVRWAFLDEAAARALYPNFETIAANGFDLQAERLKQPNEARQPGYCLRPVPSSAICVHAQAAPPASQPCDQRNAARLQRPDLVTRSGRCFEPIVRTDQSRGPRRAFAKRQASGRRRRLPPPCAEGRARRRCPSSCEQSGPHTDAPALTVAGITIVSRALCWASVSEPWWREIAAVESRARHRRR
jgi:hypothetical protein